ncbi:GNAT family N-acetyltransferase [uncultured Streptomyces sp.]|uniref:GNAT family N-acetyltransferase n=1 Tax=uncultured Streptomyces sp. TaxID=174707 RepID=UPI002631F212|nr:GNAT family N-acetyltransferase [uncultured Streptomyces sp.]
MGVSIRAARPSEAGTLSGLALRSKAYWGYDEAFMAACRSELTVTRQQITAGRVNVAEDDGTAVGFTTLAGDPPTGALGMMFVDPGSMGRGIGRMLFSRVVADAGALGFTRLTIDADPHAEPFYRAMGAVRTGMIPSGSIPGRLLPSMAVDLPD